ncbi:MULTISPECIES: ABC transporter ATP-binding protein [Bacillaceae]|uniref:ABC transporter ATP-binding protein n=1 Tax=Bacillaceae TaxID=186817 RepID=UPI001E50E1E1|nr:MULTISPECIES: ABC transporter ATP-binding protein [Bacillaceae]MCE4051104.1 ABC transporter ATP-binding protein [Bacillus sp. Au-Bac7]MCM3030291.1 ABC transporter ATP-binding protein [Niallia sp. MER 6]MDL0436828.1 ABC transporter ATP-binding protein [Niallia sp. SS-2023]UPO88261.1 ABC transporter ATP-binding protein [Niallia sp. Man26]
MSETTLAVKNLTKTIGKRKIIKDISFELKSGEVFGFLGPNGAGKTTTIRMLVGLIKPTSGSIQICGYDVKKDFSKAMERLGCIVENPELYPYLTGWENLQFFARMLKGVDDKRIEDIIELVGLKDRIHDKVKTYSLGMRQRLGIGQALLSRPKVLILDEPTNGLDPSGIREMRQFIRFLAEKEGLSVLVSSHLLSEIQLLCDRVSIILNGKIIHTESVQSLLTAQERIIWRFTPMDVGIDLLKSVSPSVKIDGENVITPFLEEEASKWSKMLFEANVNIIEMNRQIPSLEHLFLELTGGGTIE